jgi:UDPglucose 6-dehydrogenase
VSEDRAVVVVGLQATGLVVASCLADPLRPVVAVEWDPSRRAALRQGRLPFFEPGLEPLFREALGCGWLQVADDAPTTEPALFCVACDLQAPPLSALLARARAGSVLVLQSPGPPGTADSLRGRIRNLRGASFPFGVVTNPLLLRRGQAVRDFLRPRWVLLGGDEPWALEAVASLYRGRGAPLVRTDHRTAEAAGAVAESLPAALRSLLETVRTVSESWGADFEVVRRLVLPALVEASGSRYVHSLLRRPDRLQEEPLPTACLAPQVSRPQAVAGTGLP